MILSMVASTYTQKVPSITSRIIFSSILAVLGFIWSGQSVLAASSTLLCPFTNTSGFTAPQPEVWQVASSEIVQDANYNPVRTWSGYMVDQSIVEDGNALYIAYFDQNKVASVAQKIGSGKWSVMSLGIPVKL